MSEIAEVVPADKQHLARLYKEKRWDECAGLVNRLLDKVPATVTTPRLLLRYQIRIAGLHLQQLAKGLDTARRATALYPDDAEFWLLLARLELESRNYVLSYHAYNQARHLGNIGDDVVRGLFRILMQRRRYSAARRLLDHPAVQTAEGPIFLSYRAEMAFLAKAPDQCLDILASGSERTSPRLQLLETLATRLKSELAAGNTMAGIRHIAIGGVSYVGSTAFGLLMGSMPGAAFAGETHWLTSLRLPGGEGWSGSVLEDDPQPGRWHNICRVCGKVCEAFTPDFRKSLANDPNGWYGKIAKCEGVNTIISSDRTFGLMLAKDPLARYDLVLLYKSPEQQVRSNYKVHVKVKSAPPDQAAKEELLSGWLNSWSQGYYGHLKMVKPTGKRIVVQWENFVARPAEHLERIFQLLELPPPGDVFNNIRLQHFVGGNGSINVHQLKTTHSLQMRQSNAAPLPSDLRDIVASHRESDFVHKLLDNEYRRQFDFG